MHPLQIAAQYSAYVSYTQGKPEDAETRQKASQYARLNWVGFLPTAHEGLGRLLLQIQEGRRRHAARRQAARRERQLLQTQ